MFWKFFTSVALAPMLLAEHLPVEKINANVSVVRGPVNGVLIHRQGAVLAISGDPRPDPVRAQQFLFTHHRRDVVWAGRRWPNAALRPRHRRRRGRCSPMLTISGPV
jgi:hypothetical protein